MRPMMMQVKNINNEDNLMGVEIGVKYGHHAKKILNNMHIQKLFLIDPYENIIERGVLWKQEYNDCYNIALNNLLQFKKKIKFIKKKSEEASDDVPNNLDFVYIDGNHTYKFVKKDLETYYPKVKDGGVIGGHDIWSINVFFAIFEFILKKKLHRNLFLKDPDWWIIKYGQTKDGNRLNILVLLKQIFIWFKIFLKRLPEGIK